MAPLSGALLLAIFGLAHAQLENPDLTQMFDGNSCDEAFSVGTNFAHFVTTATQGNAEFMVSTDVGNYKYGLTQSQLWPDSSYEPGAEISVALVLIDLPGTVDVVYDLESKDGAILGAYEMDGNTAPNYQDGCPKEGGNKRALDREDGRGRYTFGIRVRLPTEGDVTIRAAYQLTDKSTLDIKLAKPFFLSNQRNDGGGQQACQWSAAGLHWSGSDGTMYVVHPDDFHQNSCGGDRRAILTHADCVVAANAFDGACPNVVIGNTADTVHDENWGGTKGCHMQVEPSRPEPSWQFNQNMNGGGSPNHHPICMNPDHTGFEPGVEVVVFDHYTNDLCRVDHSIGENLLEVEVSNIRVTRGDGESASWDITPPQIMRDLFVPDWSALAAECVWTQDQCDSSQPGRTFGNGWNFGRQQMDQWKLVAGDDADQRKNLYMYNDNDAANYDEAGCPDANMRFGQPQQTCAGTPFGLISMGDSETKMGASAGSCNYRPDWPQIVRALYVTPAGGNVGDDGSSNFVTEVGDCRTADGTHGYYQTLTGEPDVATCSDKCLSDAQCHAFDTDFPFRGTCWLFNDTPGEHNGNGVSTSRCYTQAGAGAAACQIGKELLKNPGFEEEGGWDAELIMFDRADSTTTHSATYSAREGTFWAVFRCGNPASHCTASDASDVNNFISQDIDIQACASGVDAGEIRVDATGWFIGEQAPDWDDHRMWVVFKDEAGGPIDSYDSGVRRSEEWEQYGVSNYVVPSGTRSIQLRWNAWEPNWDSGSADDFSMKLSQQDAPTCQAALVTNGVKGELPGETGGGWEEGSDTMGPFITQGGTGTFLRWEQDLGTQDWTSTMSLVATALDGSAATFEFNGNSHFGFEGACQCVFAEGPFYGAFQDMGDPADWGILENTMMNFVVQRRGDDYTVSVNGVLVQSHTQSAAITSLGLRPHRATMKLYDWTVTIDSGSCPSGLEVTSAPALDITATMSDTHMHFGIDHNDASNCIDGDFDQNWFNGKCCHAKGENDWLMLDLGTTASVAGVKVTGRSDYPQLEQSNGITVKVSDSDSPTAAMQTCTSDQSFQEELQKEVNCDSGPIDGRYVWFFRGTPASATNHAAQALVLCETEVVIAGGASAAPALGGCNGADLDGSGDVNVTDLLQLLGAFDRNADGDVDGNGVTNVSDLLALLSEFGNSC